MVWLAVASIAVLGGFCVVLYRGQESRQRHYDESMDKLVRQITSSNPSNATLKAMKQTADTLTDTVERVTDVIGKSFAAATGVGGGSIITPEEQREEIEAEPPFIPDIDVDGFFAPLPNLSSGNGMISPQPVDPTLP